MTADIIKISIVNIIFKINMRTKKENVHQFTVVSAGFASSVGHNKEII